MMEREENLSHKSIYQIEPHYITENACSSPDTKQQAESWSV